MLVEQYIPRYADVLQKFGLEWPSEVSHELHTTFNRVGIIRSARWLDEESRQRYIDENRRRFTQEVSVPFDPEDKWPQFQYLGRLEVGANTGLLEIGDIDWYVRTILDSPVDESTRELISSLHTIAKEAQYFVSVESYVQQANERGALSIVEAESLHSEWSELFRR